MAKRFVKMGGHRVPVDAKSGLPTAETYTALEAKQNSEISSQNQNTTQKATPNRPSTQTTLPSGFTDNRDAKIQMLEKEIQQLRQDMVNLRQDSITINGKVDSSTVQVNLRGIKRKITHSAP